MVNISGYTGLGNSAEGQCKSQIGKKPECHYSCKHCRSHIAVCCWQAGNLEVWFLQISFLAITSFQKQVEVAII